jgi:5-methylthioadenosine/S-adenosylhomocysteine deaminase
MATRLGAQALHLGHVTGSLEAGKRADLILVDCDSTHNSPRFQHDPNNAYARLVYASKSTDVTDVMVNGRWLMRDRQLLTLDESELAARAQEIARQIDAFLVEREQSVLSKLIALGGSMEEESFEVQVKIKIAAPDQVIEALKRPEIRVDAFKHYRQFDNYFFFADEKQGRLRFREDDLINDKGESASVRSRLTLIGQKREGHLDHDVLLSRSRFLAPAVHTLRFYREYFMPREELIIEKDRLRWHIRYKETELFVNLDEMIKPPLGHFLEIKSRTWSRKDAERKGELANELIHLLGAATGEIVTQDYIEVIGAGR